MNKYKIISVFFMFISILSSGSLASDIIGFFDRQTSQQLETILEARVITLKLDVPGNDPLIRHNVLEIVQSRNLKPLWFDGWQIKPQAEILVEHIRNAVAHGLCGDQYFLPQLEGLMTLQKSFRKRNLPLDPESRAILDLLLTQALQAYAVHMVEGQVDPALAHVDWRARTRQVDLRLLLDSAFENEKMNQVLDALLPPHVEYHRLVHALGDYRQISARGGWPKVPEGATIYPGHRDPRIRAVQKILMATGDLKGNSNTGSLYSEQLVKAMKSFQVRHGLLADGVIGSRTLEQLNVPIEERIRQIELNLERWRWMPKNFGKHHIRVNVADYRLTVFEKDKPVLEMPVIVGTQYRKTPVFSAKITYLEFAPYWFVPPTILWEDKLPKIRENLNYLKDKHIKVLFDPEIDEFIEPNDIDWTNIDMKDFPWFLRMDPGPWNPLGRVKFMFPNPFNVFLHDTDETSLFARNTSSFSSGCIRVERPEELASYLLQDEFDQDQVSQMMMFDQPHKVFIKPFPVHIQYWTAWVDSEGLLHFRPDLHYRDLDLELALNETQYRTLDHLYVSQSPVGPRKKNKVDN